MAEIRPEAKLTHPCGTVLAKNGWCRSRANSLSLRDHELWLVWHGRGWMDTHAGPFELRPGFCAWMRPGGVYDAGLRGDRPLGFTFIHFHCRLADPPEFLFLDEIGLFDTVTRRIVSAVGVAPAQEWGKTANAAASANVLLEGLLLELIQLARAPAVAQGITHRTQIEAMAAQMRDEPEHWQSIEALAATLQITLPHFSRAFRSLMGISPRQYQLRARLDRARHLLGESNLSVSRIAESLGYKDLFFFSRQFSKHTGTSPSAYRKATSAVGHGKDDTNSVKR